MQPELRQICSGLGLWIVPRQVTVPNVKDVFDDAGQLGDPKVREAVASVVGALVARLR
jgi:hypothetical protein